MIRTFAMFVLAFSLCGFSAAAPTVRIDRGNVVVAVNGQDRSITRDGANLEAAVSPDGTKIAYIRVEARATGEADLDFTGLYIYDIGSGRGHRLLGPLPAVEPKADLTNFGHPTFSLDGGFVYVSASAWATSSAIHQVNLRTGSHRFVIDGVNWGVIRSGPYRGYLLVGRHMYHPAPEYGSYNPTFVVRPDGHVELKIPGSDDDDSARLRWLDRNGWQAW